MESKPGRWLMIAGIIFMVIALFLRLFIAGDGNISADASDTSMTAAVGLRRGVVFTQVLLAAGCLCVAIGMLRRTEGFGEPAVRAAYVLGAAALFIAVLVRSM